MALTLIASSASADVMGGCPAGQTFRPNPTQPGAIHHAGGECIPDHTSGCSAAPGNSHGGSLVLAALGAAALMRRVRVRSR